MLPHSPDAIAIHCRTRIPFYGIHNISLTLLHNRHIVCHAGVSPVEEHKKSIRASFACVTQNPLCGFCLPGQLDGDLAPHALEWRIFPNMLFWLLISRSVIFYHGFLFPQRYSDRLISIRIFSQEETANGTS